MTGLALRARVDALLRRYGHDVEFTHHTTVDGVTSTTTWAERCLYVPLTPTFAHDVRMLGGVNQLENDQSDLILGGNTKVKEGDSLIIEGVEYTVTTVAQSTLNGINVCNHALIIRTANPEGWA